MTKRTRKNLTKPNPADHMRPVDGFDRREACAFWTWKISTRLVLIVLGVAAVLATNDFFGVFTR